FLQLDALSTQRVHHPVVDLNQPIDVGLLDLADARHEVAVYEQLPALADELERLEEAPREGQPPQKRQREHRFDGEEVEAILRHHEPADTCHQQVDHHQVGDKPRAQTHTAISYFSNRRYKAARLKPSACATLEMLPLWCLRDLTIIAFSSSSIVMLPTGGS